MALFFWQLCTSTIRGQELPPGMANGQDIATSNSWWKSWQIHAAFPLIPELISHGTFSWYIVNLVGHTIWSSEFWFQSCHWRIFIMPSVLSVISLDNPNLQELLNYELILWHSVPTIKLSWSDAHWISLIIHWWPKFTRVAINVLVIMKYLFWSSNATATTDDHVTIQLAKITQLYYFLSIMYQYWVDQKISTNSCENSVGIEPVWFMIQPSTPTKHCRLGEFPGGESIGKWDRFVLTRLFQPQLWTAWLFWWFCS